MIELMAHQAKWELRDLAKASASQGTLQRILLTLCELGFVSQDGKGGAYSLTLSRWGSGSPPTTVWWRKPGPLAASLWKK
ncbi:MAG: hypothetical protein ACLSAH_11590 [Bilophila wadsworthia]